MGEIRVVVPFDIGRCSPNLRLHWRVRAVVTEAARTAARVAWFNAGRPRARAPVVVSVVVRRARLMDADNAVSSLKALIDGCFKDAVTPDDGPGRVTLGAVCQERCRRGEECVVFTAREVEDGARVPG